MRRANRHWLRAQPIELQRGLSFSRDVAQFRDGSLHAKGCFVIVNRRFDLLVLRRSCEQRLIKLPRKLQPALLLE